MNHLVSPRRASVGRILTLSLIILMVTSTVAGAQATKTYRVTGYTGTGNFEVAVQFLAQVVGALPQPVDVFASVSTTAGDGQTQIVSAIVGAINASVTSAPLHDFLVAQPDPLDPLRQFTLTTMNYEFQLFAGDGFANSRVSVVGVKLGQLPPSSPAGFLLRRRVTTFQTLIPSVFPIASAPSLKLVTPADVNGTGMGMPLPLGGQWNTAAASLTLSPTPAQGFGPQEYWEMDGQTITLTQQGGANMPVALLAGSPDTGWYQVPGLGSVDLDISQPVVWVYDGFLAPGVSSPFTLNFGFTAGLTGYFASVQGIVADPASAFGIALTSRVDVGVQDSAASINGIPEVAPFTMNATMTPLKDPATGSPVPGTTTFYPYWRDAIAPNNGQPASNQAGTPTSFDGTYFSLIGTNFDATQAGSFMQAAVNGVDVDIALVRPDEIIFQLNQSHVQFIGGPMIITKNMNALAGSTLQIYTPSPDQMESWVWAVPNTMGVEAFGTGSTTLTVSGTLNPSNPGVLQGYYGNKAMGGEVDYYDIVGLPLGTSITVYGGQHHLDTGQFQTQCSGLYTVPQGSCYTTSSEPFCQLWFANAPQPLQDTWLHLGIGGSGAPAWGAFILDQDDGGPGVNSFAGFSQIPSSATNPAQDPDAAWIAQGTDFIVVDDFPNTTAGGFPYNYVLLLYY